ncbi:alginate lyase family protein [Citromicrobium bathyomarinum]|uniref:alginate lyase family protein n=1 Tax=Sphingomonadales TaxID=204457 RepID=UPI001A474914|nr:alginate lyase family protein [Citromicrobium sp.]|tara:strand:+ start:16439 stop:17656 length:1218 start_codon:yes stop_codon:yes gene_type:complete
MFRASILAGLMIAAPAAAQDGEVAVPAFTPTEGAPACRGSAGYAQDFDGARTFLWRPRWIEAIAADKDMRAEAIRKAEKALENGPYSVTDKPRPVPGSTANDYASIGPYWWPSGSGDGLPYTRRDGEVNPERDGPEFDRSRIRNLASDMEALALAYRITGEERFADHAAKLARAWFVTPATRMNPHFNFAQGIPGRVNGRGEGIIEASEFSTIVEALGLLWPSDAMSGEEKATIRKWYADFAVWMASSDIGAEEMNKRNNHGVFYDFYLAHFLLFAGADDVARSLVTKFPEFRIGVQMDRQGRFLDELKRTRSWHYAHFVVEGAARLATIGECVGLDLWEAQLEDGRGMATAAAFLDRYADNPAAWPFQDRELAAGRIDRMRETTQELAVLLRTVPAPSGLKQLP